MMPAGAPPLAEVFIRQEDPMAVSICLTARQRNCLSTYMPGIPGELLSSSGDRELSCQPVLRKAISAPAAGSTAASVSNPNATAPASSVPACPEPADGGTADPDGSCSEPAAGTTADRTLRLDPASGSPGSDVHREQLAAGDFAAAAGGIWPRF